MFFSSVSTNLDISNIESRLLGLGRDESLLIASAITLSISSICFLFFEVPPELQEGKGEGVREGATEQAEVRLGVGEGEGTSGGSSALELSGRPPALTDDASLSRHLKSLQPINPLVMRVLVGKVVSQHIHSTLRASSFIVCTGL